MYATCIYESSNLAAGAMIYFKEQGTQSQICVSMYEKQKREDKLTVYATFDL